MASTERQRELRRLAQARFRAAHPEECRARARARLERDREKIKAQRRARYWANPEKFREQGRRQRKPIYNVTARVKKYGLTVEQYQALLAAHNGKCAACGDDFGKRNHIDHCHTTGVVRGLLCNNCNLGVGHFRDDPRRLESAARYLRKHTISQSAA